MFLGRTTASPSSSDLLGRVSDILNARLDAAAKAPLAVAFSGGGDSLALLITACAWAHGCGRHVLALTVDHRLQPASEAWTHACATTAARLGAGFEALAWTDPKPERGLPAAARAARHRLLADAARSAGARVLLIGHTRDDVAEAQAMRAAGSTTPDPRDWTPSPAWPEGRGLFLSRPLLGAGRAEIRAWLEAQGETWIDDPANADVRYARARARAAGVGDATTPASAQPHVPRLALAARAEPWGGLSIARAALRDAPPDAARAFLAAACLCVAGGAKPPRGERAARLAGRIAGASPVTATLAGARIEADDEEIRFMREAGETARGGMAPLALPSGVPTVWDGRFELTAHGETRTILPLAGLAARLSQAARRALSEIPRGARGALPAVVDDVGQAACPLLEPISGLAISALAHQRLLAACGAITREPG